MQQFYVSDTYCNLKRTVKNKEHQQKTVKFIKVFVWIMLHRSVKELKINLILYLRK